MKFARIFPIVTTLISLLAGFYLYPFLPDYLATHWDIDGAVNGYSAKATALFVIPVIGLFLYLIFLFLPKTKSYRQNFTDFEQYYYLFVTIVFAFLFYLNLLTLFWHLGLRFNMIQALSPGFFMLLFYAGHLSSVSRRNWFVGVRTPWTLKDDVVWTKTNLLAGKMLKIISLTSLLVFFFPKLSLWLMFYPLILMVPVVFWYSFHLSRRR